MLILNNISKSFNAKPVLTDFSSSLESNAIYRLVGPNGVGKTTLLKIIKGIVTQDQGTVSLNCGSPLKSSASYIDGNNRSFLHRLTVTQNLVYFLALNKQSKNKHMIEPLMEEFKIAALASEVFSALSAGQMQLIALIRGLLEQPKLLLLDETFANIDQERAQILANHLRQFVGDSERTVILCSHNDSLPLDVTGTIQLG